MLAVTDTGCGMSRKVMEQVFEPFFTTKPEGQGRGSALHGLWLRQAVRGHIKIYSEPGHGTTIRLYLPRVIEAEDVGPRLDAGPISGGSETVLVVEKTTAGARHVGRSAAGPRLWVLKAKDAQSALAIIESARAHRPAFYRCGDARDPAQSGTRPKGARTSA